MAKIAKRQGPGRPSADEEEDPFRDALSSFFNDPLGRSTEVDDRRGPGALPTAAAAAAPASGETSSLLQSGQW